MARKKKRGQEARPIKFEFKSRRVTGKNITVFADGEPEAAVAKLTARVEGKPKTVFLSSAEGLPLKATPSKEKAVTRATRRFPVITPRLRKRL